MQRFLAIDIARTVALAAMVFFHLAWDLTAFGFLKPDTMQAVGWQIFARIIAGSFLFLAGISLWLAHDNHVRWRPALRRLVLTQRAREMSEGIETPVCEKVEKGWTIE